MLWALCPSCLKAESPGTAPLGFWNRQQPKPSSGAAAVNNPQPVSSWNFLEKKKKKKEREKEKHNCWKKADVLAKTALRAKALIGQRVFLQRRRVEVKRSRQMEVPRLERESPSSAGSICLGEEEEGAGSGVALGPSGAPMLEVGAFSLISGVFEPREKRPRRWARAKAAHSIRSDRTALLHLPPGPVTMRALCLVLLGLPALLVQGQYSRFEGITYPEPVQYSQYDQQAEIQDYYDYHDVTPRTPEEQFRYQSQQQSQQEIVPAPTPAAAPETEPTEPGPLDCREEQYPCTRLYSVHKPCKQCLNEICFYSLRRVYVINKEICVRTVCAHEELLRADLCRDKFSKCGVMATSGLCQTVVASCARSCGGC
uniref:Microfibril associated protein 2 n=3 Tax=Galloanserae TaxID=1549675 RepID=A0A8B9TPS5_ANAPL